jgi:ABC-2 type transport system permease protein
MRILAEDRKNGTEVLLLTSPSRLSGIVIGKFLAAFTVFLILTVLTFVYPVIIVLLGGKITAQLVGSYIGFILLGASFISVGVFASSITENQVVAVIVGFVSLLVMWIIDSLAGFIGGFAGKVLSWFSLLSRYEDFNKGILSLSPIVYYISFTAVFIFITIQMIEKRRWSQG